MGLQRNCNWGQDMGDGGGGDKKIKTFFYRKTNSFFVAFIF
jgi:hypothetical protein